MVKILRKQGFVLNPDDEELNKILRKLNENDGHCPTHVVRRTGHDQCPCSDYLQRNICYCKLYVRES